MGREGKRLIDKKERLRQKERQRERQGDKEREKKDERLINVRSFSLKKRSKQLIFRTRLESKRNAEKNGIIYISDANLFEIV